jgi:CBS domain-containing protein
MRKIIVADIMTRNFVSVTPDTNLLECARNMVKKKVGSLVLVNNKKLVGFISESDILWALVKKSTADLSKIKARDIAAKKIATIKPNATLEETIAKMKNLKFRRLPVVSNNEIVGLVTVKDILNFHPEIYPELEELSIIKEESEKLKRIKEAKDKSFSKQGICEDCGCTDILYKVDGRLICESCKNFI